MQLDIKKVEIIVTMPKEHVEKIRTAICAAGAGVMGKYTFCTISTNIVGTFIPSDDASPYIGESNKLEFVEETKLEVICDVDKVKDVLDIIHQVHPYEEPGIDIIPLLSPEDFK